MINLSVAIQATITGVDSVNNQAGWMIFYLILVNSGVNMIVLLGKIIYKLFTNIKDRNKTQENPARAATQPAEIRRPNQPRIEFEEHNRRFDLRYINQSNEPSSRNNDSSSRHSNRPYEVQGNSNESSSRINGRTRERSRRRNFNI